MGLLAAESTSSQQHLHTNHKPPSINHQQYQIVSTHVSTCIPAIHVWLLVHQLISQDISNMSNTNVPHISITIPTPNVTSSQGNASTKIIAPVMFQSARFIGMVEAAPSMPSTVDGADDALVRVEASRGVRRAPGTASTVKVDARWVAAHPDLANLEVKRESSHPLSPSDAHFSTY